MKNILILLLSISPLVLDANPLFESLRDTLPKKQRPNQDAELKALRESYQKMYDVQKPNNNSDEDYLWTGEPINHDDLGIQIKENEALLSLKDIQIKAWKDEGLSDQQIDQKLALMATQESEIKNSIEQSFYYGNRKEANEQWDQDLVESSTILTQGSISMYSFSDHTPIVTNEEEDNLPPTFLEVDSDLFNQKTVRLSRVAFNPNTAILKTASYTELDHLIRILRSNRRKKFEIAVHTNNWMDANTSLQLAEARAQTISEYLTKKGIKKERIQFKGYGSAQPLVPNESLIGRRLNQRVEIRPLLK